MKKYLFDANVFIASRNDHYNPKFLMLFWDWLLEGHHQGYFYSIDHVKAELKRETAVKEDGKLKNNFLVDFSEKHTDFFLKTNVTQHYKSITNWSNTIWGKDFKPDDYNRRKTARERFNQFTYADPWLIAYAAENKFDIVTYETSNIDNKRDIKLPDAAKIFNVQCVTLHEVMRLHAHDNLKFKP